MKIGGIIAEYNPFHNGHEFQLSQVRKTSDAVVAVMSGSVVQRGSIAAFDKFTRARAAVLGGVDLIIELPCAYTLAPAELFAQGAINLLDACGVVDTLYFGSECGDTQSLTRAAQIMMDETPEISMRIRENLKAGMGYRAAQLAAYVGTIPAELLNLRNNILGIEYIKAIINLKSKIKPCALLRKYANHNDTSPSNGFASANALRDMLDEHADISEYVPKSTQYIYNAASIYDRKILDAVIMYLLRIRGMKVFDSVFDAPPELVVRILHSLPEAVSLDDILNFTRTKQFSNARIRRAILSALLEINGELVNMPPQYIRVLGLNDTGRQILNKIQSKTKLPIIIKAADFRENSPMFAAEIRATELSSICRGFSRGQDFTNSPTYIQGTYDTIAASGTKAFQNIKKHPNKKSRHKQSNIRGKTPAV